MNRSFFSKSEIVFALALFTATPAWSAELPADKYKEWTSDKEIFVRMRDGVHLSTDVLLPKGASGKLPAVLVRTPYDKDEGEITVQLRWPEFFLRQGYAVVLQYERGKYFSEGYYKNILQGASTDGYDTIEWIVKQPWSNGKVGTIGCSAPGMQQWPMAAGNHPGHAAMIPIAPTFAVGDIPGNETRGAFYRGGVPLIGPWSYWNSSKNTSERPLLPPNSTQEQRIRTRKGYSFKPKLFSADTEQAIGLSGFMHLPSQDILRALGGPLTPFDNYVTWTPGDPRWNEVELIGAGAKPRVPALHINTWHDLGIGETTRLFKYLQDLSTANQYLIVGPGPHCSVYSEDLGKRSDPKFYDMKFGDLDIGDARYRGGDHGYVKLFLDWFEYWLKGEQNNVTDMPKVQLYVMGRGWIAGDQWPLKGTRFTKYYLSADRTSRHRLETGVLSMTLPSRNEKDSYVYDPARPVPSSGGWCCNFVGFDQRLVEARDDVLVYSTPPLQKPVTIAGPIEVVLYVSSSAQDTDFIVKLIDVYPDGKAINHSDDAFRVRYREGFDKKVLMQPGDVYKITLKNMVTAIRFPKGHRIRLQISSSSFPMYERNLNTGGNNHDETAANVAENSIHHGPQHPSHVVLPVLPD